MALGPAAIPSVKLVESAASEGTAGEHWRECGPAEDGEMPGYTGLGLKVVPQVA